jgi:hypothetical protein
MHSEESDEDPNDGPDEKDGPAPPVERPEADSDKTPAHTPDARRASQRNQYAMKPCPGCRGISSFVGCTICDDAKFSNSPFVWANWELRMGKL